jgi:excinuclease ABC subunit B
MYADNMTESMKKAIEETSRRRAIQEAYNEENGIVPQTIIKEIRLPLKNEDDVNADFERAKQGKRSRKDIERDIRLLEKEMRKAAKEFDFEKAAMLRDIIFELKSEL